MAETTDDRLRLLIERVERLEEEKKGIADDIRDIYAEAKAVGYDAKIMRQIVRLRKMKPDDRARNGNAARYLQGGARARLRRDCPDVRTARLGAAQFATPADEADHGRPFQIQEHHAPQGRAG